MKAFAKHTVAFLMVLCLLVSLVVPAAAAPSATNVLTTATGYLSASDVVYVKTNGIIANWGARGEVCTFLSSYAEDFYTGSNTFAELSKLSGGTASTADDSALYDALQKLMRENHTTYTSYGSGGDNNCKNYYPYTDCVNSYTARVSLLYRGTLVNSKWDSGNTYNQEHMWPNSKCQSDNEVGDIMHLRPANPTENSSRSNKAYGESSGYYDPGISVRGDCARTVLYMYVRWGNEAKMWGKNGVMENLNVLLKWMEEDPVDTWEMGRNDSVESITGTRNVFVDYPELAFLLFNASVPADMVTPSNEQVPDSGTTNPDQPNQPDQPDQPESTRTAVLVSNVSSLKEGDQIIIVAAGYDKALSTTQNNNNRGAAEITKSADKTTVTFGDDIQVITLKKGTADGTLAFNVGSSGYLYAASSSSNHLRTKTTLDANGSWKITISDGIATILASGSNTRNCLTYNPSNDIFSCYKESIPQKPVSIYKLECKHSYKSAVTAPTCTKGGYTTFTCTKCGDSYVSNEVKATGHSYEATVTAPTCTEGGYTTYICACGVSYVGNKVKATGHNYKDGICSGCGAKDPTYKEPVVTEPIDKVPVDKNPVYKDPVVTEPTVTEPVVTEPAVTEPSVTEPTVTEPTVTEPTVTEPTVTEPTVTEPTVTEPTVTEPAVTEPTVTEPTVTEPTVTEPTVTEPTVTEPTVTEPTVTEPTEPEPTDGDPKPNVLIPIIIAVVFLASAAAAVVVYMRKKKKA